MSCSPKVRIDWEDEKRLREMRTIFVREGSDFMPYTLALTRILDQCAARQGEPECRYR